MTFQQPCPVTVNYRAETDLAARTMEAYVGRTRSTGQRRQT
ncbi:MAG: hypothetical protein ACRYGI_20135 [Janthinobacterium lividum]